MHGWMIAPLQVYVLREFGMLVVQGDSLLSVGMMYLVR